MSNKINQIELEVQAKLNQITFEIRVHKLDVQAELDKFEKMIHEVKNTVSEISIGHYAFKREIKEINSEVSLMGKFQSFKAHQSSKSAEADDQATHRDLDLFEKLAQLQKSVTHIEQEMSMKRRDVEILKDEIQLKLNDKADDVQLQMLDENTTFRLNEIIRKFFKQFASKKDTTRAFDQIEMKLMDTVGGSQVDTTEDEAMFTKIPLGRGSCASCGHKLSE